MTTKLVHVIALVALLSLPSSGLTSPLVRGRITDAQTHEGLLGASVQLLGTLQGAATNAEGYYQLHLPYSGDWRVRVSSIGYRAQEGAFSVGESDSLSLDFALTADYLQGDEVVVTAEARETTARLSTTKVEVIDGVSLRERSPGTLDKVMDAVPGLEVHRTGGPVVSNVSVRGSSDMLGGGVGNRTLLLVDGKPAIISDTDGASWWLYPDEIIERVEVVKGAYSALYGSNAMGGVVNLITRSPGFREFTRIRATTGFYERPPTWMNYTERLKNLGSLSFSHSNTVNRFGYYASATRRHSDGFRESTAFENTIIFTKLKYDYSPTRGLIFSSLYLTGDNEYPHPWFSSLEPLHVRDIYTNDLQRKRSFSGDLVYRRVDSPRSSYTLRFFLNRDLTRSILNPGTDPREDDVPIGFQTRSISRKFGVLEQSTKILPYNNTLVFGLESVWDLVDGKPDDYLYGEQQALTLAGYLQDEFAVNSRFRLTAGARFDHRKLFGRSTNQQLSPKAGMSYALRSNLVLRGSVGHAFRNPSIAEMFLKRVGNQDYEFVPNPDLNPERVDFGEAGFNWRWDDFLSADGALFHYSYDDVIRWQTLPDGSYHTENLSHSTIQGGELSLRSAWPRQFRQTAAFTYLDTDINDRGPLTYVPKYRFTYGAGYEWRRMIAGATLRYVSETDTVIFYQNDAPDEYVLLDLRLTFRFRQSTSFSFLVDNVTNEFYEEMERYRMPPRIYRAELVYEFDVAKQ